MKEFKSVIGRDVEGGKKVLGLYWVERRAVRELVKL